MDETGCNRIDKANGPDRYGEAPDSGGQIAACEPAEQERGPQGQAIRDSQERGPQGQGSREQADQTLKSSAPGNPEESFAFARVALRSLPQLLVFNAVISLPAALLLWILGQVAQMLFSSAGTALTTANVGQVLLSWQGLLLAVVTTLIVAVYVAVDVFSHVYFCEGLLTDEPGGLFARAVRSVKRAIGSLPRFKTLAGVSIFVYIVLIAPLAGVGFSTGLTRDLYVPHFIMSVIEKTPAYFIAYTAVIVAFIVVGLLHFFSLYYVLLDEVSPAQALRESRHLVRSHFGELLKSVLKLVLVTVLLAAIAVVALVAVSVVLEMLGQGLTPGEQGALVYLANEMDPTQESIDVSVYRIWCFFANIIVVGLIALGGLLIGSCTLLYATHLYHWCKQDQEGKPRYAFLPKRMRAWAAALLLVLALLAVGIVSLIGGFTFDFWANRDLPVQVIAHRLGGDGAPENSTEGLKFAIEEGCYGAETDIQRTKDGQYVINHDNDFSRLCGTDATSQDMTLEEVEQLRIRDPLHPGTEAKVPTLEELLDVAKGRIKLFVEFKGATADCQMVDDAVRIVREHGAEDDVVFISLNYDCIEYGKETYPEFDYGLLIFAGFGDMSLLKCDIVLAEEEMTTDEFVDSAHEAGKTVGVWTANSEDDLRKVLFSDADYVITDKVVFSRDVQEALDVRTDNEVIQDLIWR